MINGWSTTAFDPPTTVNKIYRVAATWVKPTSRIEGGTAASFLTIKEDAKQQAKKNNKEKATIQVFHKLVWHLECPREEMGFIYCILKDSPSLCSFLTDIYDDCYQEAVENMRIEYDVSFPDVCPFSKDIDGLLNHKFWQDEKYVSS